MQGAIELAQGMESGDLVPNSLCELGQGPSPVGASVSPSVQRELG
jgi:hypothetical protein